MKQITILLIVAIAIISCQKNNSATPSSYACICGYAVTQYKDSAIVHHYASSVSDSDATHDCAAMADSFIYKYSGSYLGCALQKE